MRKKKAGDDDAFRENAAKGLINTLVLGIPRYYWVKFAIMYIMSLHIFAIVSKFVQFVRKVGHMQVQTTFR